MFKDKTLLVTGGTGSFGNAVMRRFLNSDIGEIRIFSRDEKKQDDMRKRYNGLEGLVREAMGHDLLLGDLFLFVSRNRKRAKVLLFDGTGLCI